jgi:peroxiredoxin
MTWPYPAPEDDGGAAHLVAGTPLPSIGLPTTEGQVVNPAAIPGRTVIFVYPWTGRPGLPNPPAWDQIPGAHGSTPQAEGFRDLYAKFAAQGVKVYGLSSQDSGHQRELALRLKLPFPLLSDTQFSFADGLQLPRFTTGGVTYLKRLTILATSGTIARVVYPVHPPDVHAANALAMLRAS